MEPGLVLDALGRNGRECLYNYVVTAQSPTAVTHCAVGSLTSDREVDLVVAKSTVLELYTLKREGLQPVVEWRVNGRIAALEIFRQQGYTRDSVLILTERYCICIIHFDPELGDWETVTSGTVHQRIGREAKHGPIAFIDPESRTVGLHLYDGQLRITSIVDGNFHNFFNIHMDELNILHMCFLSASHLQSDKPVLAVLHEDTRHVRRLKTYTVDLEEKELEDGPWFPSTTSNTADMMIPIYPYGGLLLVGESQISYLSSQEAGPVTIPVHETSFKCYAKVDDNRYLLSDHMGHLYVLVFSAPNHVVEDISCQRLGEATPAACISYLDSGIFFLGSKCGDSELIKLVPEMTREGTLTTPVKRLSHYINLGPILDFCVVDLERQGQCQLVTCSGAFAQGSLRVIRNGIGMTDQATVSMTGIKGLWNLKLSLEDEQDALLIVTCVDETCALAFSNYNENELTDAQIPGFQVAKQTLHCANMIHNTLLQVTRDETVLVSCQTLQRMEEWFPGEHKIIIACSSPSQVLLACENRQVIYFQLGADRLTETWRYDSEDEISCLDITPIGENVHSASFAAVGTWERNLLLLNLDTRSVVLKVPVSQEVIPRSVLFSIFEGQHYLLVAMGDGRLLTHEIDAKSGALSNQKRVSIGTKPVTLSHFVSGGSTHVFASSDRPTVIYGDQKKLMFSNLNEQNVNYLASFHTKSAPQCLALAKDDELMIGNIDEIQKLHIKSVYLREMPRRICHQAETHSYGVLIESYLPDGRPQSYFRIFDDETFEVKESFRFEYTETGTSILSLNLPEKQDGTKKAPFYLVGSVFVLANEHEPMKGRLLVFSYDEALGHPKLTLMTEKEFKGAVFSLKPIRDRILATVNSKVHILEWRVTENGKKNIHITCTEHGHILAVYSDVRDNFIIIGDLMRSISLSIYSSETRELEARARDAASNWMTAVKALDDDIYLGAENSYNLFTVKKVASVARDEEGRLETVGQYHLGEYVNVLREGSLVANCDLEEFLRPPVLFGTINGQIGLILSLKPGRYLFLEKLQAALQKVIRPLGAFDHKDYRRFYNERQSRDAKNFIDGDLIEGFLDLKKRDMDRVAEMVQEPVDEIYKLVEDLHKLH